jgi:adhesin/invasin
MRLRLAHAASVLGVLLSVVALPGLTVTGCNGGGGGTFVGGPVGVLPDATKSTVVLTTGAAGVKADGIDTALVTVTLLDANGEPVPATVVTAAASPSTGVTITQAGVSDANGVMKVFLTGSVVQSVVITATATFNPGINPTSVVITQTATVDFVQPPPVLASGSTITVTPAPPGTVVADGTSTASIKVSLKSATGLPVPAAAVTFAATGTNNTLSAASGNTDASGNLTVTLASTKAEVKAITATITSGNIVLPTVNATFVAGPPTGLTISAPTFTAGVPQTITVSIVDAKGNTVTSANNELALNLPTLGGAVYNHPISSGAPSFVRAFSAGNTITVAQGGVASFSGLVLQRAGNYTVGVVGAGFFAQTSFTCVANTAFRLIFAGWSGPLDNLSNQPTTTNVGAPFNPVVKVLAVDVFFNPTTTLPTWMNVGNVSLAPSGTLVAGDLTGNSPQPLVNGVATFTGLAISNTAAAKDGCTFTASCAGGALPSAGSAPFSIRAAGAPVMIKVAVAGSPFTSNTPTAGNAFTVTALDSAGTPQNAVTGIAGSINLVGSDGSTLTSLTANIAAGKNNVQVGLQPGRADTFTLTYTTTGDGVVPITQFVSAMTQTSTNGLPNAVTFTVNNGAPSHLVYANMDPGCGLPANTLVPNTGVTVNSPAGVISSPVPNIEVHAVDAAGNLCMTPPNDYKGTVTLSMAGGTGTAALNPLNPTAVAVAGVARFNALAFTPGATPAGTGYVITPNGTGGLSGAALSAFNIIPAGNAPANAAKLVFLNSLTNTVAGDQILTTGQLAGSSPDDVIVQVQDFYGTPIKVSFAFTATLDLLANTGVGSDKAGDTLFATFAGPTSPSCDGNGICHFQTGNVSQSQACASYVLRATSGTLNPGCSNPIDILPGPAENVNPPVLILDIFSGGPPALALHQVGNTAGFNNQPFPSVLTPTQGGGTGLPYLQVYDSQNNVATTFAGTCTAQLIIPNGGLGPTAGVLVGNTQVSFSSGNAIFTNLGIQNQSAATMPYSGLIFSIPGLPGYTNTTQASFFTVHSP